MGNSHCPGSAAHRFCGPLSRSRTDSMGGGGGKDSGSGLGTRPGSSLPSPPRSSPGVLTPSPSNDCVWSTPSHPPRASLPTDPPRDPEARQDAQQPPASCSQQPGTGYRRRRVPGTEKIPGSAPGTSYRGWAAAAGPPLTHTRTLTHTLTHSHTHQEMPRGHHFWAGGSRPGPPMRSQEAPTSQRKVFPRWDQEPHQADHTHATLCVCPGAGSRVTATQSPQGV